jgi:hypothetical protein
VARGKRLSGAMAAADALNDEERRALIVLARLPDGCAEAWRVAEGFSIGQLSGVAIDAKIDLRQISIMRQIVAPID